MSARRQVAELELPFEPPLAWPALTGFLAARSIPEIERVTSDSYRRTIAAGALGGAIEARPAASGDRLVVRLELPAGEKPERFSVGLRDQFDLDADPAAVAAHLGTDSDLSELIDLEPGLRVPGGWDPFELAVRAILGQQVTVRGAATLGSRLVRAYGRRLRGLADLSHLFPEPSALAAAGLADVGLPAARAATIRGLAAAVEQGRVDFAADPMELRSSLVALPGIGDWTAQYVAMRAARDRDAFPGSDLALLRAASADGEGLSRASLRRRAEGWRPWRAYAAMYLWRRYARRLSETRARSGSRPD